MSKNLEEYDKEILSVQELIEISSCFEFYWNLCSFIRKRCKTQEEYNLSMQICRPAFLDRK